MVNSPVVLPEISTDLSRKISLEEYLLNPPKHTEWIDQQLIEKNGMTAKHGRIQARLARYWGNYMISEHQGGEVYTETPCLTLGRGRCPDVSYLTPDLVTQFGSDFNVLPQSFILIAEIISPTDKAEEIFIKVNEYLQSGCQEVWLVLPQSHWIFVITAQQKFLFTQGEVVKTQNILKGFSIAVDELLV